MWTRRAKNPDTRRSLGTGAALLSFSVNARAPLSPACTVVALWRLTRGGGWQAFDLLLGLARVQHPRGRLLPVLAGRLRMRCRSGRGEENLTGYLTLWAEPLHSVLRRKRHLPVDRITRYSIVHIDTD